MSQPLKGCEKLPLRNRENAMRGPLTNMPKAAWPSTSSRSKSLYDRGEKVMPGGITRIQPWQDPFPIYAARGEGSYVIDVDGTRRFDLLNNFASLIHGHANPSIVDAVLRRIGLGTAFTLPTEAEIALAETIVQRIPAMEQVRFSNSGSEAVMCAIKAARALTGRPKFVKIEGAYHGMYDYAEVSLDPGPEDWGNDPQSRGYSHGVPKGVLQDVIVIPFNDVAVAERIIRAQASEIAAILVDAAPSHIGFVPASREFIEMTRRVSRDIGALLILDEVISFRLSTGGAQTLFNIDPDITVLAKIIGGGFPVGAVAGRREVMSVFDHRKGKPLLPWSGTFTANPVSMVAGKVSLDLLNAAEITGIDDLGERARKGVSEVFRKAGFAGQITGIGSMFKIAGHRRPITDYRSGYHTHAEGVLLQRLQEALLHEGYHISSKGMGFISTVMTRDEIDEFVVAVGRSLERLS
ncbi:glutamate-1-semialdehyde 2,1-aminomutase [Bradyrhizobium sp. USDA 4449]